MDIGDGGVIPVRKGTATCPFFSGGCTVYDDRPFMCRLFGTAPDARLTCPHGCRPKQMMTAARARTLTDEYQRLPMTGAFVEALAMIDAALQPDPKPAQEDGR